MFLSSNFFLVLASITKFSIQFASTLSYKNSWNILFIILSSKLHSPKYITFSLSSSLFVKNATFYLSPLICMLLYSQIRSSLLKYFIFLSLSITSLIMFYSLLYAGSTFCSLIQAVGICSSLEYKNIVLHLDSTISSALTCSSNYQFNNLFSLTVIVQALAFNSFSISSSRLIL